jgi:hypothetical protein
VSGVRDLSFCIMIMLIFIAFISIVICQPQIIWEEKSLYLDGQNGDDSQNGSTQAFALKSFSAVAVRLKQLFRIVPVMNQTFLNVTVYVQPMIYSGSSNCGINFQVEQERVFVSVLLKINICLCVDINE